MSEPIEEGTVLGGRYRVIGLVTSSDDQDLVLNGMDQVLNRQVAILVAATDHATQTAESARQIAIGERTSPVQVLDLGISHGRTYLVANEIEPDHLLELVYPPSATPYVEPFYTDTLGSEIFGESRQLEPQVYEDDEEYYGTLHAGYEGGKRSMLDRFADRLAQRRADRAAAAGAAAAGAAAASSTEPETSQPEPVEPATGNIEQSSADDAHTDQVSAVPPAPSDQQPAEQEDTADDVSAEAATEEPTAAAPILPPPPKRPPSQPAAQEPEPATEPAALIPEPGARSKAAADEDDSEPNKLLRLLPLVAIALVVIVGVVIAMNSLNGVKTAGGEGQTGESPSVTETTEGGGTDSPSPSETEEPTVTPVTEEVTRVVPDQPDLNAEYDSTLPLIIDGNNATSWNSYTFQTANFGGFAANMALVVKLEEESDISDVKISQSGGSGGAIEVLVSDTPDLADAKKITTTSFTGPEINISVSEDGQPAKAQYVIVNVTELPRLQGGSRPFGMRIAEIAVS
ncbi:hypothetical protein [Micrococcoides hystricis]|uniref:ABC transporter substrate-binding protein n=1 Tax=Micrococcoides hystricis TaxID=1572761 RepID=A0ABV6PBM8_9MICC